MLFGSYIHNLDDKNRLSLPSKLLTKLSHNLYLLKGFDGCLSVYLEDTFQNYVEKITQNSYFEKNARDFARVALSSVVELEIDKSNRISIPVDICRKYGLTKKVVVIGVIDHLEIWDFDKWNEYENSKTNQFEAISEVLGK